jgi:hypothetical protein
MIVGLLGLVLSLVLWGDRAPWRGRRTYIEEGPARPARRTTVVEDDDRLPPP